MGGEDGVVGLHDRSGNLGSGVDGELQLGLLAVVHAETLQQQGGEAGAGASAEGVEDEESLESGALVSEFPDAVQTQVHDLLSDGVVTARVVVSSVFLASDELFRVEELSVGSGPHFVHHSRLQIQEDGARDVFPGSSLAEEGVEGVVATSDGLVAG